MPGKRLSERGKTHTGRRKPKGFQPVSDGGFKPASLQEVRSRAGTGRDGAGPEGSDNR